MWRLNLYGFKLCVCEYVIRIKCGSGCGGGSGKKNWEGVGGSITQFIQPTAM